MGGAAPSTRSTLEFRHLFSKNKLISTLVQFIDTDIDDTFIIIEIVSGTNERTREQV